MKIKEALKKSLLKKRTLTLLLFPVGYITLRIAESSSYFAEEIFGRHIFKAISLLISNITGIFPFSVAEIMIICAPFVIGTALFGFVRAIIKNKSLWLYYVSSLILNLACAASVVYFCYSWGCGINYYRYPVATYFDYEVRDSSKYELAELLGELCDEVNETREALSSFDENGVYVLPYGTKALSKEARAAFNTFAACYPIFGGHYPAPKRVILSHLMSYTRIIGIYTCWTMEANVDTDISDYEIGSTMCHELSHLRGFIREDESNFISYMVCMASDSPDLNYSGAVLAFTYTANALAAKDSELYAKVLSEHPVYGVWDDFAANREYWEQFEKKAPKVAEAVDSMNDTYLKANDQEDGVESYGRVVDLLLAKFRKDHGL